MSIDDEIDTIADQAWHTPSYYDEMEAYLRKHTLNGAMRELHEAWAALCCAVVRDVARLWLRILDTLGI